MICPVYNGMGETVYYVETDLDENTVTIEQRKGIFRICNGSGEKPMTNADRIRSMNDEELAEMLWKTGRNYRSVCADPVVDYNEHRDHLIAWLKQPAE